MRSNLKARHLRKILDAAAQHALPWLVASTIAAVTLGILAFGLSTFAVALTVAWLVQLGGFAVYAARWRRAAVALIVGAGFPGPDATAVFDDFYGFPYSGSAIVLALNGRFATKLAGRLAEMNARRADGPTG